MKNKWDERRRVEVFLACNKISTGEFGVRFLKMVEMNSSYSRRGASA